MATVALKDVMKVFADGTVAVDRVNLDVGQGEFMVLLGPTGLREVDPAADGRGPGGPDLGRDHARRRAGQRPATARARGGDGLPGLRALPAHDGGENIGFPLRLAGVEPEPRAERVAEVAGALGIGDVLARKPGAALRWPAPAGRDGPRHRAPAHALPHGRAAVQPGQRAAGRAAGGDLRPGPRARRHHDLRHARPGRGADHGRPGGDPAQRASCRTSAPRPRCTGGPARSTWPRSSAAPG